jgi:hypothetical protein
VQMTPMHAEQMISSEMLPGERVEWIGHPNPSVIFHAEDWLAIPLSLMWGGFAIIWFLGASGIWNLWSNRPGSTFEWFGVVWGTPFVVVGQYMMWGRFVYRRWEKQRSYYALTNKRAMILRKGIRGRSCSSASFDSLPLLDKRARANGNGNISFGGPVTGGWQWRHAPRPLTFDDLDDADSVHRIAIRLYEAARKTDARSGR